MANDKLANSPSTTTTPYNLLKIWKFSRFDRMVLLIVALLVALAGVVVPIPLMALDLLIGLLQAYIFAVLTTVYIGAAIRVGEET